MHADRTEMYCALCGPEAPARVRFPERVHSPEFDFAARKVPRKQHFRIMECVRCGLVYSNPILPHDAIYQLYEQCPFIQEQQLENMRRDYRCELERLLPLLPARQRLLEVGCSSGFFLKAVQPLFDEVRGVELGEEAIRHADPSVRPNIVNAPFSADLFPPGSFDVVCFFQILDHLLDPVQTIRDACQLLKPGGLVVLLNHNIRSWFPRVLGERCPMYDVEHIYLFDQKTVSQLLQKTGFEVVEVRNVANGYTLDYAVKMFPFPNALKSGLLGAIRGLGISQFRFRLPGGNMLSVGRRPLASAASARAA
jgi:2-polyprenyl-3-methyl-5-hydroxy-6-metoxy-1,4-benzoquinol methylase